LKKIVWSGAVVFILAACENSGRAESKADSLRERLDTAVEKLADSAKAKGERTLEAIKEKVKEIGTDADSVKIDSTQQ
jgi:hypothetical protein